MSRTFFTLAFAVGLVAVLWVGAGFVGTSWLAWVTTGLITATYLFGAHELRRFRAETASLQAALADVPALQPGHDADADARALGDWLERIEPGLRQAVRLRIQGERVGLAGPALTPYLVGLLVMLGMLGTFLGMVVTFKGAVFALEGSTDLQAIRAALAEPIKGLSLSFGTSVAGVATSAMLGLMSALSRRERVGASRLLDARLASSLRPLTPSHRIARQREEVLDALRDMRAQSQVLPDVLPQVLHGLQALAEGLERRSQQLGDQLGAQLLTQQNAFHQEARAAYTQLADSVSRSLQDSLSASARAASEGLQPVVQQALTEIARESAQSQQRLAEAVQAQLDGVTSRLDRMLQSFNEVFEQRTAELWLSLQQSAERTQAERAQVEQDRQRAWSDALGALAERVRQQADQALSDVARLIERSEVLIAARVQSEDRWVAEQGERMAQLTQLWRTELGALRSDEVRRADAAVARLGELQSAVSQQLATLGQALEAPMSRLMQTASEVPQAAAEVIAQLRGEMAQLTERDTRSLQERAEVMAQIRGLLQAINQASGEQRAAIESLAASAASVMDQASRQFAETLGAQAGKTEHLAAHVMGSAIELSTLGEAFNHGVQLFSGTNDKLVDSLQRMESAIQQSMARSDEQLAYYVAQAREVIDLSISAQQGIVEDLRRLHGERVAQGGTA